MHVFTSKPTMQKYIKMHIQLKQYTHIIASNTIDITKKRMNNKMVFVKLVLNSWENEIMSSCCEPHGTK